MLLPISQAWAGETLQYDARGNIKGRTVDGRASAYNYDVLDRIKSETGKATQAFCYDANGNRTCDLQASYTVAANSNRLAPPARAWQWAMTPRAMWSPTRPSWAARWSAARSPTG